MPCYWLFLSSSYVNCFFSLDDDVETDEFYGYPSKEFAEYQATECEGKYSLTWTIVTGSHWLRFFPLSIRLAFVTMIVSRSYHMLSCNPDTAYLHTYNPFACGMCVLLACLVLFELESVVIHLFHVYLLDGIDV